MIHHFPKNTIFEGPHEFTDPFRYAPHPLVRSAAAEVIERIEDDSFLSAAFAEGKMLGILVCDRGHVGCQSGDLCYVAGFSGTVGGKSVIEGFVPPIFDLTDPDGYFRKEESRISDINRRINILSGSDELKALKEELAECERQRDEEIGLFRAGMMRAKKDRDEIRMNTTDPAILSGLVRESQFEKAEFRRLKASWDEKTGLVRSELDKKESEISDMKAIRAEMSDRLQDWIFRQYIVHNALGEESSIADIFAERGLVPPGGTGECAAPKMLEYAFRSGLRPLAMGEFWYGKASETAVRVHGRFYPACTSKCGPLLAYMLAGEAPINTPNSAGAPEVVYEDGEVIVVKKPGGMPSVPGLDGGESLLEWLEARHQEVHAVHRLDMDTSGVMVFAKTNEAAVNLRRQFEDHTIRKTYTARLSASSGLKAEGAKGIIELPLAPDYDERPRQKVDMKQGKTAITEYEVVSVNEDGTTDILFHPVTGRTHQLRVHAAHHLGLGCPIVGDFLYGGDESTHLHLQATSITFKHPVSGEIVQFRKS